LCSECFSDMRNFYGHKCEDKATYLKKRKKYFVVIKLCVL
jgi:hypothetical protein